MSIMTDFVNTVLGPLLKNSGLQLATVGLAVKFLTDELSKWASQVDKSGEATKFKAPLQVVIAIASAIVSAGDLALQGQLSTFSLTSLTNFLTTWLTAAVAGVAAHHMVESVKASRAAKKEAAEQASKDASKKGKAKTKKKGK